MLAGGVIALLGAAGALWIDAATFLISSAIIWSIRYQENLQGAKQTVKGVIQDFAEGFRFIRASRTIRTVSLMGLLINFGIMPPLGCRIKGKRNKNAELSRRSLEIIDGLRESVLDGVKEESHEDHH